MTQLLCSALTICTPSDRESARNGAPNDAFHGSPSARSLAIQVRHRCLARKRDKNENAAAGDCLLVSIQCVCHSVRCTTYSGMAVLISPANSIKRLIFPCSRVLPCGFSDVRNCCETSNRFMMVENKHGSSKCSFVLNRLSSSLRYRSKSQHACTDAFAYTVVRLNYAIGVGDLQNRMCSDIALTSKGEILDTSFVASTPARSGHWE